MAYIEVDIDIDEYLDEATTNGLIMELKCRHRIVLDKATPLKKIS